LIDELLDYIEAQDLTNFSSEEIEEFIEILDSVEETGLRSIRGWVGWDYKLLQHWISVYLASDEYQKSLPSDWDVDKKRLAKALSIGFEEGESMQKIAKRINPLLPEEDLTRALNIARSEVIKVANQSALAAYKEFGLDKVVWITSFGACPICVPLDGNVYDINKTPMPVVDTHPRCRCALGPYTK